MLIFLNCLIYIFGDLILIRVPRYTDISSRSMQRELIDKFFVNRENMLNLVDNFLDSLRKYGDRPRILFMVGIGGIGKTWVLKKIEYRYESKKKIVFIDLGEFYERGGDIKDFLWRLRIKLNELGFKTIRFDTMMAIYSIAYEGREYALKKREYLDSISELMDLIPGIDILSKMIRLGKIAYEKIGNILSKWVGKCRKWFVNFFGKNFHQKLLEVLADNRNLYLLYMSEALKADINSYLEKSSDSLILLIDRYEFLHRVSKSRQDRGEVFEVVFTDEPRILAEEDIFIVFVSGLKNTLIVIASRDKVYWHSRWPELEEDIKEGYIKYVDIIEIPEDGIREYLIRRKITDKLLQDLIIEKSHGVPYLMTEITNAVLRGRLSFKDLIALSGDTIDEIYEKFLRRMQGHMSDQERKMYLIVAIPRFFTIEMMIEIANATPLDYKEFIKTYSYVLYPGPEELEEENSYRLHERIRDSILRALGRLSVYSYALDIANFLLKKFRKSKKDVYLCEYIYVLSLIDEKRAFGELKKWVDYYAQKGAWDKFREIVDSFSPRSKAYELWKFYYFVKLLVDKIGDFEKTIKNYDIKASPTSLDELIPYVNLRILVAFAYLYSSRIDSCLNICNELIDLLDRFIEQNPRDHRLFFLRGESIRTHNESVFCSKQI